jgi:hypothetical protein
MGELEIPVNDEVLKAVVLDVARVFWNHQNEWNCYIKVVDFSLGKVGFLICVGSQLNQGTVPHFWLQGSFLVLPEPEREYSTFSWQHN